MPRCLPKDITFWSITVYKLRSICPFLFERAHRFAGLCISYNRRYVYRGTRAKLRPLRKKFLTKIIEVEHEQTLDKDCEVCLIINCKQQLRAGRRAAARQSFNLRIFRYSEQLYSRAGRQRIESTMRYLKWIRRSKDAGCGLALHN